jgi:hypothetical protein
VVDESVALRDAEVTYAQLTEAASQLAIRSRSEVEVEAQVFDEAMVLQRAALNLASAVLPSDDAQIKATIGVGCFVFDMLLNGWRCVLEGFYSVAMHLTRSLDEACDYEMAFSYDRALAEKFFRNKRVKIDRARGILRTEIARQDPATAASWAQSRRDVYNVHHQFAHVSLPALSPSILLDDQRMAAVPSAGGMFDQLQCKNLAAYFARAAIGGTFAAGVAFRVPLSHATEWDRRQRALVARIPEIVSRWEGTRQEMVGRVGRIRRSLGEET